MTQEAESRPTGCVLRNGGPLNGVVIRDKHPVFVALEYEDGTHEIYRPTGVADIEHSDLERYDCALLE